MNVQTQHMTPTQMETAIEATQRLLRHLIAARECEARRSYFIELAHINLETVGVGLGRIVEPKE